MEKRRITFKGILCLLVLLALAAGAYCWSLMQPDGSTVVIEQDGEELYRIDFTARTETETLTVNGTVIEVGPAGAAFVSSPCPDQVCVEAGLCDRVGETAVCLPQRVSIRIVGDGGDGAVDAMTG